MLISDWSSDVCSSDLDYHLSVDLADKAIALIDAHVADKGDQPFFLNLGFGTAHSPIQVPREYSAPYDAIYEKGWDRVREERFARDRKSVVWGQSVSVRVDLGGRRIITKKT